MRHGFLEPARIGLERDQRRIVALGPRDLEQLPRVAQPAVEAVESADQRFEVLAFAAKILRAPVVAPHGGVFAELDDFGQATVLRLVVKDTSATPTRVPRRRRAGGRWR
jgi:hypothetical protein